MCASTGCIETHPSIDPLQQHVFLQGPKKGCWPISSGSVVFDPPWHPPPSTKRRSLGPLHRSSAWSHGASGTRARWCVSVGVPTAMSLGTSWNYFNMEVENPLFVVENGLPYGAMFHFHVSSRECRILLVLNPAVLFYPDRSFRMKDHPPEN